MYDNLNFSFINCQLKIKMKTESSFDETDSQPENFLGRPNSATPLEQHHQN